MKEETLALEPRQLAKDRSRATVLFPFFKIYLLFKIYFIEV